MLFFSAIIIVLVGDKTERLLHIVFALFLKFGQHYLSIYFRNSEIVSPLESVVEIRNKGLFITSLSIVSTQLNNI